MALPIMTTDGREILKDGVVVKMRGLNYLNDAIGQNEGNSFATELSQLTVDAAEIAEAGFTHVRVYSGGNDAEGNPISSAQVILGLDQFDANSIGVILNKWVNYDTDYSVATGGVNRAAVIEDFEDMVTLYKDHNAVVGFAIANENNYHLSDPSVTEADFYSMIDEAIAAAKVISSRQFYTCVAGEVSTVATTGNTTATNVDVWTFNIYRGKTFSSLRQQISSSISKPCMLMEYGYDRYNNRIPAEDAYGQAYRDLALAKEAEAMYPILCGHFIFAWADQWWRTPPSTTHNNGGNAGNDDRDATTDEEWWGLGEAVAAGNSSSRPKNISYDMLKDRMQAHAYGPTDYRESLYNLGVRRLLKRNMGKSLVLDGIDDLATCPLVPSLAGFSFGLWVKLGRFTNSDRILDYSDAGPSGGFNLLVNVSGAVTRFFINVYAAGANIAALQSRQIVREGWYHVAGTIKVNEFKIYVNSVLEGVDVAGSMSAPAVALHLGRRATGATNFSKVFVSDLVLKNGTVWTQSEIDDLYYGGEIPTGSNSYYRFNDSVADLSGNGNDLTLTGGAYSTDVPIADSQASPTRSVSGTRESI